MNHKILGTGQGYSVLDVIHAFEAATGQKIPFKIVAYRYRISQIQR